MGNRPSFPKPRGVIRTPAFMPVGTAATVKGMYPEQVRALGADVVLGNKVRVGASAVIDGHTTIGDESEIYPFASVGMPPQDLEAATRIARMRGLNTIGAARKPIMQEHIRAMLGKTGA